MPAMVFSGRPPSRWCTRAASAAAVPGANLTRMRSGARAPNGRAWGASGAAVGLILSQLVHRTINARFLRQFVLVFALVSGVLVLWQ